jgi:hypothetical protein
MWNIQSCMLRLNVTIHIYNSFEIFTDTLLPHKFLIKQHVAIMAILELLPQQPAGPGLSLFRESLGRKAIVVMGIESNNNNNNNHINAGLPEELSLRPPLLLRGGCPVCHAPLQASRYYFYPTPEYHGSVPFICMNHTSGAIICNNYILIPKNMPYQHTLESYPHTK